MYATFGSSETGDVGPTFGPFPFAQLTFDSIRAGDPGGDAYMIAVFDDGLWRIVTPDGPVAVYTGDVLIGSRWTDVSLHNDPKDALA